MSFISTLKEQSSAYAAYVALVRLPKNAPRFPDSPHGYPIVEPGELFCRLEGVGRPCCGTKLQTTESLLYHMEAVHGAMMRDRPLQAELSRKNVGELERLDYFYKHLMKDEGQAEKSKPAIKVESSPEVEARPAGPDNLPWLDDRPEWLSPPPHEKRKLAREAFNEVVSKKSKPTISPNVEAMVGSSLPTPTAPKGPPSSRRRPPKDSSKEWFDKWSTADGRIRPDAPPAPISLWFKEREQAERQAAASRLDTSSTANGLLRPDSTLPAYDRLQKQRHDQLQKEMREQAERELERQRLERRFRRLREPPCSPGGLKRKAADEPSADSLTEQTPLPPLPNKRPRTGEHRPASVKAHTAKPSTPKSSDDELERIATRGAKLLNDIAVKEAAIKSELKEAQLKEVRIKAELLEVQLLEAQMAQDVSKAKLKQVQLEKELQEIKEKDERVKAKLEAAAVGKGKVVDLLDDEEDT